MILLPFLRTLVITPPKTASRSLHEVLCGKPPYGGWASMGPSMDGRIDHHTTIIPGARQDYRMLASVRHPLDRLVSLWCHLVDDAKKVGQGSMAFYIFAAHVGRRDASTVAGDPFFGWNLSQHLEAVNPAGLLRSESLKEDLEAAGLPINEIPAVGRTSGRGDWISYYDTATLAAVEDWAKPDCERFGYEWPESLPRKV